MSVGRSSAPVTGRPENSARVRLPTVPHAIFWARAMYDPVLGWIEMPVEDTEDQT